MNGRRTRWPLAVIGAGLGLLAVVPPAVAETLRVELGAPIPYRCAEGRTLAVRYGRLSDGSLSFARLSPPGDRSLTLPRLASGSGARYSDEANWQWWTKGPEGFLERRDDRGEWRTVLTGCRTSPQGTAAPTAPR